MKRIRYDRQERRPESQRPQPLATEGLKLPEGGSDEVEAWEAWLRHVQATSSPLPSGEPGVKKRGQSTAIR